LPNYYLAVRVLVWLGFGRLFRFLRLTLLQPPGFKSGNHLFFIAQFAGGVKMLIFEGVGQILLFHEVLGVVMGVFIVFTVAHVLH